MIAAAQRPAAVVRPFTRWRRVTMMVPAPMKPMPATTWAPRRAMSVYWPRTRYRYWLVSVVIAAPRQIRIWVRKPAGRRLYSRSMPMMPPQTTARVIRRATDQMVTSRNPSKRVNIPFLLLSA